MIKLYLDENIPQTIAIGLRLRGYTVITTKEAHNSGKTDFEQLNYAIKEKLTFFTFNVSDFAQLHLECLAKGKKHKGIILSKQRPVGLIINSIIKIWLTKKEEEIENNIIWLSDYIA
jgi:predicted nuclease of predicted toxin-antitoxin system